MPLVFPIFAQGVSYSHFLNSRMLPCWHGWQKMRKWLYLSPWAKIEKTKGSLFSQTLKVEENKVSLVFSIFVQELRFSLFLFFCQTRQQGAILKFRKWLYLSPWAKIEKTKGSVFSQTLKVEENKVSLVFFNFCSGAEIQPFSPFLSTTSARCHPQIQKMAISQPLSQNWKN